MEKVKEVMINFWLAQLDLLNQLLKSVEISVEDFNKRYTEIWQKIEELRK